MTMLAKNVETGVITREGCEARIALYREQIGTGYIGIGKTLNEAKAAGVVPHGNGKNGPRGPRGWRSGMFSGACRRRRRSGTGARWRGWR